MEAEAGRMDGETVEIGVGTAVDGETIIGMDGETVAGETEVGTATDGKIGASETIIGMQNGERIFMKVPDGFQKYYPSYVVLKLLRTLYGLKQAAMQFWRKARKAMRATEMTVNKVDPCLFYKWKEEKLLLMLLWVDNFCIMGPEDTVYEHRDRLKELFECKDLGEMHEYVGCLVTRDREKQSVKLTQPVKIQQFKDEYNTTKVSGNPKTPAEGGNILKKEGVG